MGSTGKTLTENALAVHLIDQYRDSIKMRYSHAHLSRHFVLSSQLTEEVIHSLRNYFLDCLYPTAEERRRLDEAFDRLSSFVNHPAKTWALLGNMASALIRFGMQLPQALKAGIASLESYVDAKRFENDLLKAAIKQQLTIPFSEKQFESCIAHIPRKEIERFTHHILMLFESLTNTRLLKKTIVIMEEVLDQVKKNKRVYTKEDAEGIELGIEILRRGYALFRNYPESLKKEIINTIRENEKWYLDKIYGAN